MQQPEAYIGDAASLFDGQGNIINASSRELAIKFMDAFATWVTVNCASAEAHP